ncbi:MAG: endo-1,4-beta-xylanase, partial [Halorhabdus sp.]
ADSHLDSYHQTLRKELKNKYDLPAGKFLFGATEQATIDGFTYNTGGAGKSTTFDAGDSVPFSTGVRCTVEAEPSNSWSYSYQSFLTETEVSKGDVLLGVAYVRSKTDGAQTEAKFKYRYKDSEGASWTYQSGSYIQEGGAMSPSEEWTRHYFPIKVTGEPGSIRDPYMEFWLGFKKQTVEFGGLALIDYSDTDVAVSDLPSGAPSTKGEGYQMWSDTEDPYYSTLVSDLKGYNLGGAGHFVNGTTESAVWDTYEIGGGNPDLVTKSALDVSDDDVPFSEAARFDVTEAPENPWGISFKSYGQRKLAKGDVLLGVAYMRTPDDKAQVTYKASSSADAAANYVTKPNPPLDSEWKRFYFPIEFGTDIASGEWWTEIWLGSQAQTVDIGGLAVIDFAQGVQVETLPAWEEDISKTWEKEADKRIQEHRKTDFEVEVLDSAGNPVEGADVEVAMQEHAFGFGTAVSADYLVNSSEAGDKYREIIKQDFNTAVLGNHHKWRFFEESRDIADSATEWLLEQDKTLRGHVCLWADVDAWAVPTDVAKAMGVKWEANGVTNPQLDPQHVRERSLSHIEEIINYYEDFKDYGSVIDEWEVYNEPVHKTGFVEAVNGKQADEADMAPAKATTDPIVAEWYKKAEEVALDDTGIAINDYSVLAGPYPSSRKPYRKGIEFLVDEGVDLDGIGLQCHFNQGSSLTPTEIWEGLEYYTGYGADIRITEFDMADSNWPEADKAEFFHQILKVAYSHPDVDDFMIWGFWDQLHWRDDAPFFDVNWNPKPAYDVWQNLVFDEWWTEKSGSTDAEGVYATSGFKGTYTITATDG